MATAHPLNANSQREATLARLSSETFDVAIIGGGITGAAVARDAAMRGLTTALVEKDDFAGATSSRSSKLIHGGLRYLPQGQLRLVYEALHERERLRHLTAPHLVHPVEFLFPFYRGAHPGRLAVCTGLILYDLFARTPRLERHRRLDRREIHTFEPALKQEQLRGGAIYLDAWGDDARITLENVIDAALYGAAVSNYVAVEGFACGARPPRALFVRELESGKQFELRGRIFVNAAGPWLDDIRQMDDGGCGPSVRLTKGAHLVLEAARVPVRYSLTLTDDRGRVVFVIRHGAYVLVGTTDTDFEGDREQVGADPADAAYLLDVVSESLPDVRLSPDDVVSSFGGIRTLKLSTDKPPSSIARDEVIIQSNSGLISAAGGKLTTHRAMAARVIDRVMKELGRPSERSPTAAKPLPGARHYPETKPLTSELPPEVQQLLAERYGSRAEIVASIATEQPELAQPLTYGAPAIAAEVIHAVRNEFARTVGDFLIRRTAMNWRAPAFLEKCAPAVARILAKEMGWDAARERHELESFLRVQVS
jgi:glycerol-3-phosphate dehydrogenase